MQCFKPANATDKIYPGGWPNGITVDFAASKYLAPSIIARGFGRLYAIASRFVVPGETTLDFGSIVLRFDQSDYPPGGGALPQGVSSHSHSGQLPAAFGSAPITRP